MAINDDDLDLDTEKEEEEGKSSSGMKKIILLVVIALVVITGTVGATLFFTGVIGGDEEMEVAAEGSDGAADGDTAAEKKPKEKKELSAESMYHLFEPPFTVNFNDNGKIRFLQVGLSVSTRDKDAIETMLQHEPVIRNNLVLLFSSQKSEDLYTREGKDKLRDDTLSEIQNVMKANTGDVGIDNVYFTGFVIQ